MELIDARTGECRGEIQLADTSFVKPVVVTVTIHVDKHVWELLKAIIYGRKKLIKEFRNAYGQAGLEDLRGILDRIDQYAFTIAAHQRYPEEQVRVSTRNLSAVTYRYCHDLTVELHSLITNAENKLLREERPPSKVPLYLIEYTRPVSRHALIYSSYMLTAQDSEIACLKTANDD